MSMNKTRSPFFVVTVTESQRLWLEGLEEVICSWLRHRHLELAAPTVDMLVIFLHFQCYCTWDCIPHTPHTVTYKHNPKMIVEVSIGVTLPWNSKDALLKLVLLSWGAQTKCVCLSEQEVRMSREWEADLQSFLYNTTKNISYAFCSSWSTFAFAHFCTKPVLPVGLEVTTALIFGDRSMVFIKWKTPFVHPQNWKHHSLVFWRHASIPILMETHSPPADKEKHCDLMEFVVNLTDIMM